MTIVVTANVAGQARGEPVRLSNRRRRLSTIVARHRPPAGRRFVVSLHRQDETAYRPNDGAVRLRADWSRTLVGPKDVVLITVVPLGRGVASIGLAIAAVALIAIAPYAAPGIAAGLTGAGIGVSASVVQAGLVIGGIALSYAAQASAAAKKQTQNPLYSVSGGGNIPKANARRPLLYGKSWSSPPLSQKDYFSYDGDTMVLVKRMTLGIGKFKVHRVRVGDALYWTEAGGIQAPFDAVTGPLGAAFEILYETPSTISPGDVITSTDVGGQEMPRVGGNPDWTPWFRLTPQGVTADAAQMSHTYPAIYRTSSAGRQVATVAAVVYQAREIDPVTGNVVGEPFILHRSDEGSTALTVTPLRRSAYVRLPRAGMTLEVRAQNAYPDPVGFIQENRASWDEMVAFKDDLRVRAQTTEIAMRVRAGKGLTVTAFSDVSVEATRIVPVWDGATWTEQPTSKAVWAFCDLVRAEYGLDRPNGVDADKALYYADLLDEYDVYDGQLPEVSSFWEAAGEILLPLRADPVKVGATHSFVRDESRAEPRHVLTRRQIVRDSGGATYRPQGEGGDVIVEFNRDGDPKRPDEVRFSYGPPSRTPKRYKVAGISDGKHAVHHATWLAAIAVFRGAERRVTTEWDGRLVFPGDHVLSDLWFLRGKQVFGVAARTGNLLQLDTDADVPGTWGYGSIRTRVGREWGILRMRGVGRRGLELHPEDVSALAARTGLGLPSVLAGETQDPTTIVLGDLVELQETYVARSAIPSDADHVQIELVRDDARVWQLLDETVIQPAPVNADSLAEPLVPEVSVLHARCQRIETGIEVVWGVSITRGARNYEADISYDGSATWEVLSPFGPASSGRAQMRQVDGPVSVRARAYGRTGLHGDYVVTTFTTVAPVVQLSYVDGLEAKFADVDAAVAEVAAAGDAALRDAEAALRSAQDLLGNSLRDTFSLLLDVNRDLNTRLEEMAQAAATEAGQSYLKRQFNKVAAEGRVQDSFAAIQVVNEARITDKEAFAGVTSTLGSRLTTAEGTIVGQATALQSVTTRVTNSEGVITSTSQAVTSLTSRVSNTETGLTGQATAAQQLTTRVTSAEGGITALSQSTTSLQSQITTQGGQISGQATAAQQLTTRVTSSETGISSLSQQLTALNSTVATQGGQIVGNANAIQQVSTNVTAVNNNLVSTAQSLTALQSVVANQGNALSGQATAVQSLTTRVSSTENGISSLSQQFTALNSTVYTQSGQIVGNATQTSALSTVVSNINGQVQSQASSIQALSTTQAGHTATLTTYGTSINGQSVQFGVTGSIDGVTGGFVFSGVRRLDGAVSYGLRLQGDLIVDGTITARTLTAQQLIQNGQLFGAAATQVAAAGSGGTSSAVGIYLRGTGTTVVLAFFNGNSASGSTAGPGQFVITRDGAGGPLSAVNAAFALYKPDSGNIQYYPGPMATVAIDNPGVGGFTYRAQHTNGQGIGGVTIVVMEQSK